MKSGSGAPGGRSGSYNNDSLIDDILTKTGSGGKVSDDLLDDILREEASKKAAETGAAPHTAARKTTPDAEMKPADIPVKAAAEPGISGKEQNPAAKAVADVSAQTENPAKFVTGLIFSGFDDTAEFDSGRRKEDEILSAGGSETGKMSLKWTTETENASPSNSAKPTKKKKALEWHGGQDEPLQGSDESEKRDNPQKTDGSEKTVKQDKTEAAVNNETAAEPVKTGKPETQAEQKKPDIPAVNEKTSETVIPDKTEDSAKPEESVKPEEPEKTTEYAGYEKKPKAKKKEKHRKAEKKAETGNTPAAAQESEPEKSGSAGGSPQQVIIDKSEKHTEPDKPEEPVKAENGEVSAKTVKAADKPEETISAKPDILPAKPETLSDLIEYNEEDAAVKAEIAASVRAAIAERTAKAAESSVAIPESDEKPEKKKKKAKKSAPEIKPLKPIFSIANIVYTAAAFGIITVAFLALPREGVSETEQRNLAQFPEFSYEDLLNGNYTNGITDYFNDNIPYRDQLKKAAAKLRSFYGVSYRDAEIVGPVAVVTDEPMPVPLETSRTTVSATAPQETRQTPETAQTSAPAAETTAPETTAAPETAETTVETTKNMNEIADGVITNGQVVTKLSDGHWWGISLYGGGSGTVYADALNRFKQELGDSVNVYSMPIPTSGEYYLPDTYAQYNASHHKSIEAIDSRLSGIISVPADMALWEHTDEDIYLRTDHHWQPLGAYYAAKCFAEYAGVPFADISTMERVDVPGYMGTMYGFTESANLLSDPETFTYYKPTNNYTTYYYDTSYNYDYSLPFFVKMPTNGSYSTFMGGDSKIVRIKTDAGTGRKLVVFKDSYGNAEIPFYFGSFDEIWVCDMRYFDLNAVDFVKFTGATDLLFTMCTFSAVGTNANGLNTILGNPATEIIESAN